MTVKQAYLKYEIPPNLQEHMLRVAGISTVICSSWNNSDINLQLVQSACLFHDMGNLLKFDLINKANFLGEEEKNIEHWKAVKDEMVKKYGSDEHNATSAICHELNLKKDVMWIIENWGFGNFEKVLNSNSWEYKVCVYSDHRIGPFGIVSLEDRFAEQKKRYQLQKHESGDVAAHLSDRSEFLANCAFDVEKQIQTKVSIDLKEVTDDQVSHYFETFLNTKIN